MIEAAVITVSDSCSLGQRVDLSGPAVATELATHGFDVRLRLLVADEQQAIEDALRSAANQVPLVVTTGGTGISPRDVTPEATRAVCHRLLEGVSEVMRAEGRRETPYAALSRAVCGTVYVQRSPANDANRSPANGNQRDSGHGESLVLNLPGSPRGALTSLRAVLPLAIHALELLSGRTEPSLHHAQNEGSH
ncbi:molybdenum cofactor synthesis domain-containing protein [Silvibacterium bohemicum]|uniref:Molybdopterin adenylyltransferase n=1 Tax=Silvibacterium bohemicum TaxID=1577686 RepID=A0A841JVT8_9BACT|nr:MogA/MoaB family molybdenum cofactor biosynthesis protein [Silvibacterium bohemicum]MBB6145502.1 molybdenum cofactor synthesis domain-containing protein [Silvibacterium bohemicum]